jgi:cell division protein FtsQ
VASGGRPGQGSRLRARAESAVVSIPRPRRGSRLELGRAVPSARSVVLGLALVAVAVLAYLAALTTGLFAVQKMTVGGADPKLAADVRRAVGDAVGESLVAVDLSALQRRVEALPTVAAASFDRAFPHELAVTVVPERPVAVLRRGADSWLVSARGRMMGTLPHGARLGLPRIWIDAGTPVSPGDTVAGDAAAAVRAVAPLAGSGLALRVRSVIAKRQELTLVLASGLEVRLGDAAQVPLKLAVAATVAPRLDDTVGYLDVAVPERPVAGSSADPQAEVESQGSTNG